MFLPALLDLLTDRTPETLSLLTLEHGLGSRRTGRAVVVLLYVPALARHHVLDFLFVPTRSTCGQRTTVHRRDPCNQTGHDSYSA